MTAALIGVAMAVAVSAAEARDLVYGAWVSPKHGILVHALPPFFDAVEKQTGGAVKWKLVAGGQLVSGRTTLPGIRDGIIDAGFIIPSYTPKELPGNALIMEVQVFGNDTVAASAAAAETVMLDCPQCLADFRKQNAVYLAGHAASAFNIMCKPKVEKFSDLRGLKVRASGSGNKLVKMFGAVPTPMSPAEGLTSMERGALDCVLGAIAWLESYGYQDIVKTVVDYPLGIVGALGTVVMNRDTWNNLTLDQKRAHLDQMPRVSASSVIDAYIKADERVAIRARAKGISFVKGSPEYDQVVSKFEDAERQSLIATGKRLGVKDPEAILAAYRKNLKKWQGLSPAIGTDVDKYSAALKREIYDRIDPGKL